MGTGKADGFLRKSQNKTVSGKVDRFSRKSQTLIQFPFSTLIPLSNGKQKSSSPFDLGNTPAPMENNGPSTTDRYNRIGIRKVTTEDL